MRGILTKLTAGEAASLLGISRSRVLHLVRTGRIEARRIGERMYLLESKDVAAYAASPARKLYSPRRGPTRPLHARK